MASKEKPARRDGERWLLTRKTWRYMADAGRRLIPEGWAPEPGPASYQPLEENFQQVCKKEKSFLLWPRKKKEDGGADEADALTCSSEPLTPLGAGSLTGSEDEATVVEDQQLPLAAAAPMFGLTEAVGVQTDVRLQPEPLPPVETDSGKGTEAEVSTPETPLSPLSVVDSRSEPYKSTTSVTSGVGGVGVFGDLAPHGAALRKDSMTQASGPAEADPKLRHVQGEAAKADGDAEKKEASEQPSPMLDRFGDKLSRYLKMARRDSATRDKDKKDRFKTVNYDKTLRNIKSKRINPDTLEDMGEDVKPLDLDDPPKSALSAPSVPRPAETKKKKRRGIQVGEPLPQYILDSLRGAFAGFRPTRKLSKAESEVSACADEKYSDPLSPRYSITVSDDLGTRDLTLSDIESSTMAPFSVYSSARTSLDVTGEYAADEFFASRPQAADQPPTPSGWGPQPCRGGGAAPPGQGSAADLRHPLSSPQAHTSTPKAGFFARRLSSVKSPTAQSQQSLQQPAGSKRGLFSSVMQKTGKTGNHGSRVVAKKLWKSRSKSQSRTSLSSACVWTPQGTCQWINIQNRVVTLCDTTLLQLTEIESAALQQVALEKLHDFNLGCTVRIPKDCNVTAGHKPKRRPYLLKKRPLTTGFFDTAKREDKGNNNNAQGRVFGIPLKKCMENDRERRERGASPLRERLEEPASLSRKSSHGGSHASFSSLMDAIRDKTSGSCESLNMVEKRSSVQDSSLSLASDGQAETALQPHVPQVPSLVTACIQHIEAYGLQTVGIFRVSSSKKRARQLREEFDSGADVTLGEELCPHDVATLIKEYFRDLPEPLLPHDLYQPFLATQKIRNRRQQFDCLQHLIRLLAVPNRDTLWALLSFLKKVADGACDRRTPTGDWLTGNRMDSNNLATLFAPNMLHSLAKLGSELSQQTAERIDVINVIRSLIDHNKDLFEVPAELLQEAYQLLMEKQPEALDVLPAPTDAEWRRRCRHRAGHQQLGGARRPAPRRLSSPELDVSGVITASLRIPAAAGAGRAASALAGGGAAPVERIPYIEECQTVSGRDDVFVVQVGGDARRRCDSSGSEAADEQAITGSLSIQPLSKSASGMVGEQGFVITSGGGEVGRPQVKVTQPPAGDASEGSPEAPPPASPRRCRPRPADHVTHGQLVLPSSGAEVARSRTSPNITHYTVVPVTANVFELQACESDAPQVWKRRQLIASDTQTGV
ncbi:uncharacterized protein LOC119091487 [Pollicipes pollicipes]|uniref:uncharacterized protein LOC119091487 n=1 Tax=Pollicipes pollicipes TaxID=41117 RepID=UPI00188502E5|nr:uncharacterized protein LOC119091487 [Pollicipes pollicipes]